MTGVAWIPGVNNVALMLIVVICSPSAAALMSG
jgi:hypothetical protein